MEFLEMSMHETCEEGHGAFVGYEGGSVVPVWIREHE